MRSLLLVYRRCLLIGAAPAKKLLTPNDIVERRAGERVEGRSRPTICW